MRSRTVILTSVVLSVLASAVTTMLLAPGRAPAPRTVSTERVAPPEIDMPPVGAASSPTTLEERVRRIETRLDTQGVAAAPRPKEEALATLLAIEQGGRQLAIKDSFLELVALGNDVVPEIVALLKSGRDQDWGGAFSLSGNVVGGYPRLRTLLIDALRQIGTPEAHQGLIDGLRGSEDATDYRDLFMLFRTTTDATMVNGMNGMLAAAVRELKEEDPKKGFMVAYGVADWIQRHEFEGRTDLVEEMARIGFEPGRMDRTSFALLVSLSPERASDLTREVREKRGADGVYAVASALSMAQDLPRARLARYLDILFSSGLSENERLAFYGRLPSTPCESIQPPTARAADAQALLDFLRRRLAEEATEIARQRLTHAIGTLEDALRQ